MHGIDMPCLNLMYFIKDGKITIISCKFQCLEADTNYTQCTVNYGIYNQLTIISLWLGQVICKFHRGDTKNNKIIKIVPLSLRQIGTENITFASEMRQTKCSSRPTEFCSV